MPGRSDAEGKKAGRRDTYTGRLEGKNFAASVLSQGNKVRSIPTQGDRFHFGGGAPAGPFSVLSASAVNEAAVVVARSLFFKETIEFRQASAYQHIPAPADPTSLEVQESPDFTMTDKEWIDKIDGSKLTLSDIL